MTTYYEFGLKFRQVANPFASFVVAVEGPAAHLTNAIQLTVEMAKRYPALVFDGTILYGTRDT